jgi:membrane-bound lytic murein transglycosylase D
MELRSAFPAAVGMGTLIGIMLAQAAPSPGPGAPARDQPAHDAVARAVTFDLPVVWNESVARFVRLFEHEQTDRIALYLKRAGRYEGMIREKLRERGMPEDLLYLSMIESGFNPNARSSAQAVGLWQFMAPTARQYGLRVDAYVDERRDPEKATDAALRYLQDLYGQFGSWNLAAAAYNTGGGRVSRIMIEETGSERGQDSDFWRIRSRLPRDTREYVPLIYAAAVVGKQPERYGLDRVERWLPLATDTISVPGGTSLGVVASAVGVSEQDIRHLNPHLVRGATPPGQVFPVLVPDGREPGFGAAFRAARAIVPAPGPVEQELHRHRVRSGESLWTIARDHGTTVAALQRENGLGRRTSIRPGQTIRIPA